MGVGGVERRSMTSDGALLFSCKGGMDCQRHEKFMVMRVR